MRALRQRRRSQCARPDIRREERPEKPEHLPVKVGGPVALGRLARYRSRVACVGNKSGVATGTRPGMFTPDSLSEQDRPSLPTGACEV